MNTRGLGIVVLVFCSLACAGCRLRALSVDYHESGYHHEPVHLHHVCTHHCHDHYWDGTRVVVIGSGHRHGPGCGHLFNGRHWVLVRSRPVTHVHTGPAHKRVHTGPKHVHSGPKRVHAGPKKVRAGHVHGPGCGHAYHRKHRTWIVVGDGHVHGPGCGHVFIEGRWTIRF